MFRSLMIAAAALSISAATIPAASANTFTKVKVSKTDAFGDHFSKTKITKTDNFGDKFTKTRVVINPAGPGKIVATKITKTDAFGDKVIKIKVVKKGF